MLNTNDMKTPGYLFALGFIFMATAVRSADLPRQYYELRVYTTENEGQQNMVNDFWRKAAIPAYRRASVGPIGVFTEQQGSPSNRIYVLIPYSSLEALPGAQAALAADRAYQAAAAEYMDRTKSNAPYASFDSSLLHAMSGMPGLALPPSTAEKKPWIFELRTYFSPTEGKGANKIDMFNAGEIQIMKEIGLNPVFFAGTIHGPGMPNLIYMTSGPDMDEYKKTWKTFGSHPLWKKLSGDAQYKGNMSGSQSVFLKRTSASDI